MHPLCLCDDQPTGSLYNPSLSTGAVFPLARCQWQANNAGVTPHLVHAEILATDTVAETLTNAFWLWPVESGFVCSCTLMMTEYHKNPSSLQYVLLLLYMLPN